MITEFQLFERYTNKTINYYAIIKKIHDEIKSIIINKSNKDHGLFTPSLLKDDVDDNTVIDCEIKIDYTKEENIIELATHELLHCYEYLKLNKIIKTEFEEVKEIRKTMSFKINKAYLNVSGETIKTINNEFEKFIQVVRNTFNSEFNARTTQLYGYLLKFDPDENILKNELLNSKTIKMFNDIEEYINTNVYNRLKNDLGEEMLLNITNKFNYFLIENGVNQINGYEFIKVLNSLELEKYYNKWIKLFKHKNNKHYEKIMSSKFIDDIIKRKNDLFRDTIKENCFISEHDDDQFSKWMKQDRIKDLRIKKLKRVL